MQMPVSALQSACSNLDVLAPVNLHAVLSPSARMRQQQRNQKTTSSATRATLLAQRCPA